MDFISFADHSHFELLIEQLKQVAQEEQNSKRERENSIDSTGVEEEVLEEVTLETNVCFLSFLIFL